MTDYNDGKWYGWNGGECPVHPQSVVDIVYVNAHGITHGPERRMAMLNDWNPIHSGYTVAFRVVTPYVEPVEYTGECYASYRAPSVPTFSDVKMFDDTRGKWTATRINGKLARIVWEAAE
jgi:hypothetical protein